MGFMDLGKLKFDNFIFEGLKVNFSGFILYT